MPSKALIPEAPGWVPAMTTGLATERRGWTRVGLRPTALQWNLVGIVVPSRVRRWEPSLLAGRPDRICAPEISQQGEK